MELPHAKEDMVAKEDIGMSGKLTLAKAPLAGAGDYGPDPAYRIG